MGNHHYIEITQFLVRGHVGVNNAALELPPAVFPHHGIVVVAEKYCLRATIRPLDHKHPLCRGVRPVPVQIDDLICEDGKLGELAVAGSLPRVSSINLRMACGPLALPMPPVHSPSFSAKSREKEAQSLLSRNRP
jgi:hypothetical protein